MMSLRCLAVFAIALVVVSGTSVSLAQDDWKHDVEDMLNEFLSCQDPIDDQSPCNYFLGRALKRVYSIDDFDNGSGGVISANAIVTYVMLNTDKWTSLGAAGSQSALTQAAGYANLKKAIIAVKADEPHGHVALILPGNLAHSGNWNLDVPNSASFFLKKPQKSYVGKGLSFAFQRPDGVTLYGRNF